MTSVREQVLGEFIDAWNAGDRPDIDDYVARVPAEEQLAFGEEVAAFMAFAPTPAYSPDALRQIRVEIRAAEGAEKLFPALLARLRDRVGLSTREVADELLDDLGLTKNDSTKAASYLDRLESGSLDATRVSRRVLEALGKLFGVPAATLEGAADRSDWSIGSAAPAPVFRADHDAAARAARHLEVLGDALAAPGGAGRDEVDELFLGGR
jgi:hypothetical protein